MADTDSHEGFVCFHVVHFEVDFLSWGWGGKNHQGGGGVIILVTPSVAEPEPPVLRRLLSWSRFFSRLKPLFMAAPAPAGSFKKAKKTSLALVICKLEVSLIYRDTMIQK